MRFTTALFLLLAAATSARAGSVCDDSKLLYKTCSDQNVILKSALNAAKHDKKLLVVTFGADWCGDCHSLHGVLDELQRNPAVQAEFSFASIGIEAEDGSGSVALKSVLKQAGIKEEPESVPYLCIVNPSRKKATCMDTTSLERRTEKKRGHDPEKVLAALNQAKAALR